MKWSNVVKYIRSPLSKTQKHNQEIKPPQHVQYPNDRIIILDIKETKIYIASHP